MIRPNIVTVYNSPNCGSFLQGFALGEALSRMTGCAPRYVETGARSPKARFLSNLKWSVLFRDLERFSFEEGKSQTYVQALGDYTVVPSGDDYSSGDLLVFGSDEIWNLGRSNIAAFPAFWGSGLTGGGARVAYAPSANGADLSGVACADNFKAGLASLDAVSVRDRATQCSVQELLGAEPEVVCDPTLLLDTDYYRSVQTEFTMRNYVLVYSYGFNMTKDDVSSIKRFASSHGLKLVSAGTSLPWCDVSIPAGPFEFLGLMDGADYVVTDTFHGTVFASIYHKRFGSYARTNTKVVEYLRSYGLESHMIGKGRSLDDCLMASSDYSAYDICLSDMRERSLAYLQRAVDLCAERSGQKLTTQPIEVRRGVSLAPLTTFKMGGKAARLWVPKRGDDLCALPKGRNGYRVLSAGSNLLVSERTFTDVISMREYDDSIEDLGCGEYRVGASVRVQRFISKVNADGYGGIEALVSVPAMVGGLICMNASVPSAKTCISDYLVSVEVFDGKKVLEVPKEQCGFGYRTSVFQDGHALILSGTFKLPEQDPSESQAKIDARRKYVKRMQDKSAPNFGSVFSCSSGKAMGLIRKKGLAVGGISFSRNAGNWLLNNGGTFVDAMAVLGKAKKINKLFGKKAKLEVRVWR